MIPEGMDESLMQEFLTEAGELIESLDADLVELESDPGSKELLDSIFRALHTIKGAASFLALTNLIEFAHAAEDALNRMRKGELSVDQGVVDVMLRSVDVIRAQLDDLGNGEQPRKGPGELLDRLRALASGQEPAGGVPVSTPVAAGGGAGDGGSDAGGMRVCASGPLGASVSAIVLPAEKLDVLPFMASDLRDSLRSFADAVARVGADEDRSAVSASLSDAVGSMRVVAEFFEFGPLLGLLGIAASGASGVESAAAPALPALRGRLAAVGTLIAHAADGIERQEMLEWAIDTLAERTDALSAGESLPADLAGDPGDPVGVLALDGIGEPEADEDEVCDGAGAVAGTIGGAGSSAPSGGAGEGDDDGARRRAPAGGEQTVRVEVERLEALMNLVGEMVLAKNQVLGLSRHLSTLKLPQETHESINATTSDLDRLTSELQMAVMRTRMQPLNKLFGKYPRLIRDLGRKTAKRVELVVVGGDTEVDKSVLELLADPLVHILRNSVDHGMELPGDRVASGKPEFGTITVSAEHQGGHVCVRILDDGRGIDARKIGQKAIEKGLASAEQVAGMSDREIYRFIFAAGFSTAEQVSDLSGRGVGMDVVRTNVSKLGGEIGVDSTLGQGTTIEIMIPLTVAILPAMMVSVGVGEYAIPIASILEIVGLRGAEQGTISKKPVLRLRDDVLPLIDLTSMLGESCRREDGGFVVVVQVGQERVGLVVDRLIGQREVVIKPLEDEFTVGGPFSGATIREDGDVSLILDVVQIVRMNQSSCQGRAHSQSGAPARIAA
ncbi:MAG: chemotaxis protein CheA [Phycisphaerales bacterium]